MKSETKGASTKRRLVVYLPEATYKALWHHAIDVDKAASALIAELVEEHLKSLGKVRKG